MRLKILAVSVAVVIGALAALSGCASEPVANVPERRTKTYFDYFDTVSQIIGYEDDEQAFEEVCENIRAMLEKYHMLCDIYHGYDGMNNLYTVNKNAGVSAVSVDEWLIDMLLYAEDMSGRTGGMFDVTMGSVLSIWHDHREQAISNSDEASVPDMQQLKDASVHTGYDKLVIDEENMTVYITDPQMSLDVGGIAKGYAVNCIVNYLCDAGVSGYALNIGGNISVIGAKPDGTPEGEKWTVGIQNPDLDSDTPYVCSIDISDMSVVTSGDYQRYYYVDGVKYHHIINPYTLMPQNNFSAVSVVCSDSGLGDCLSTALFNMSVEEGKEMLHSELFSSYDIEVVWILPDGSMQMTDGFSGMLSE